MIRKILLIFKVIYLLPLIGLSVPIFAGNSVTWREVVTHEGARIGWGTTDTTVTDNIKKVYDSLTISTRQKGMKRVKVHLSTTYIENQDGTPLSVVEHSRVGHLTTRREVKIQLPQVEITINSANDSKKFTLDLPENTRFDEGDGLIESWDFKSNPKLSFNHFNLSTQKIERIELEIDPTHSVDSEGRYWATRSVFSDGKLRQQTQTRFDKNNQLIERLANIGGKEITIRNTDQKTALSRYRSYDVIKDHSIKSPYTIPKRALNGHIRYEFSFADGFDLDIPQTAEQSVKIKDKRIVIDVCSDCGVSMSDDESLDQALGDTAFLQASHPAITKLVKRLKNKSQSDEKKLAKIAKIVNKKLPKIEFVGHATAVQSLKSKSGDCTEFAVLYATLARAVGIPARVVSGLAYSRENFHGVSNVFIPHAWIQAWVDGRWRSYDASLGSFDSSHIALRISDGEPGAFIEASQIAAKLNWESLSQIERKSN